MPVCVLIAIQSVMSCVLRVVFIVIVNDCECFVCVRECVVRKVCHVLGEVVWHVFFVSCCLLLCV